MAQDPRVTLGLYFDHNIPAAVAEGLRRRGVDVLMARDDGYSAADDEALLSRAMELGRLLVSIDRDFRRIATAYQREGREFGGVLTVRSAANIGLVISDLEVVAQTARDRELSGLVLYIPF
jgi:hypothetical protein